jgi:hypothetical protein
MTGLPFTVEALDMPMPCTCGQAAATGILYYKFQNQEMRPPLCDNCRMAFIEIMRIYADENTLLDEPLASPLVQ